MWSLILLRTITNNAAKAAKRWLLPCFQFCDCPGTSVEKYVVISSVYALIDYVMLIFYLWLQADHTLNNISSSLWWANNVRWNHADQNMGHIWKQVNHRLNLVWSRVWSPWNHIIFGPVYDQPGMDPFYSGRVWSTCFCMGGKPVWDALVITSDFQVCRSNTLEGHQKCCFSSLSVKTILAIYTLFANIRFKS